jgi:hypothetical protein
MARRVTSLERMKRFYTARDFAALTQVHAASAAFLR